MKAIHNKKLIIILSSILGLILICVIGFTVYVNDFYHAMDYTVPPEFSEIAVKEYKDYTLYGDADNSDKGIIFYPGGKVEAVAYEPLMYELAAEDICCILMEMPFNLAVFGINKADEVIEKYSEIDWYMAGHSLGGAMASTYSSDNMDKISGLILLAAYPTDEFMQDFPVIIIYGSEDKVLNAKRYDDSMGLAQNFTEKIIEGGNHAGFGNYGVQSGDGNADISSQSQWEITVEYIEEWITQGQ